MQSCLMILFSFSLCPTVIVPKLKKNSQSVQKPPWLRSEQAAWLSWVITVCHIANGMKRIFPYSYYNSKSFAMLKQFDEIFADIQKSTFRFPHFFFDCTVDSEYWNLHKVSTQVFPTQSHQLQVDGVTSAAPWSPLSALYFCWYSAGDGSAGTSPPGEKPLSCRWSHHRGISVPQRQCRQQTLWW